MRGATTSKNSPDFRPALYPQPVFFPLWLTGDCAERVEQVGGRLALLNAFGPGTAEERVQQMTFAWLAQWVTIAVMLLLFVTSAIALAMAFALFGFYLTAPEKSPINLPSSPSSPALPDPPPDAATDPKEGSD